MKRAAKIYTALIFVFLFAPIVILLVFLRDLRPTLITAVSIPLSVIFAIVLMYFSGVTLNMISLAGLAIGVGMLVDNSIVVVENISSALHGIQPGAGCGFRGGAGGGSDHSFDFDDHLCVRSHHFRGRDDA